MSKKVTALEVIGGVVAVVCMIWLAGGVYYSHLPIFFLLLAAAGVMAWIGNRQRTRINDASDDDLIRRIQESNQRPDDRR